MKQHCLIKSHYVYAWINNNVKIFLDCVLLYSQFPINHRVEIFFHPMIGWIQTMFLQSMKFDIVRGKREIVDFHNPCTKNAGGRCIKGQIYRVICNSINVQNIFSFFASIFPNTIHYLSFHTNHILA